MTSGAIYIVLPGIYLPQMMLLINRKLKSLRCLKVRSSHPLAVREFI